MRSGFLNSLALVSATVTATLLITGCGPTTFSKVRTDWQPAEPGGLRQQIDEVTVDVTIPIELPSEFYADAQKCGTGDSLVYNSKGEPVVEKVLLAQPYQLWRKVAITNQSTKVLRLNSMVARLFTPDGREWEPLAREEVLAAFKMGRTCPTSEAALAGFRGVRLLQRSNEIITGSTSTTWVAFQPPSPDKAPGVWKLGLYDMPVKLNDVGTVAKIAPFEFRFVSIKYVDTYRQENLLATPKLISTEVVGN